MADDDAFDDDDDRTAIKARIAATRALIVAYEAAVLALSTGAQSYQLDTGQSRQFVTKAQLGSLQLTLSRLESRLATLQQQLGKARFNVVPGW